jgi:hypothetical protein
MIRYSIKSEIVLLLVLSMVCRQGAFAQGQYLPGYLLTNSNDTVRGLVAKKSLKRTAVLTFKEKPESIPKTYYPFEIYGYGTDSIHFESCQSKIAGSKTLNKKEFYQIIFKGKVRLVKRGGRNFFIARDTMDWFYPFKKNLLYYFTSDNLELKPLIKKSGLYEDEIVDLLERYHNSDNFKHYKTYSPKKNARVLNASGFVGYNYSNLRLINSATTKIFNPSYARQIGLSVNFLPPSRSRGFSFNSQLRVGKELFQYQNKTSTSNMLTNEDILYESFTAKVIIGFKKNIAHSRNFTMYINPGACIQGNFEVSSRRIFDSAFNNQFNTSEKAVPLYSNSILSFGGGVGVEKIIGSKKIFIEFYVDSSLEPNFNKKSISLLLGIMIFNSNKK